MQVLLMLQTKRNYTDQKIVQDSYEYESGSEYEPEPYTQTPANRTPSPSSTTSQPPATPAPAPEERESTHLSLRTISSLQSKFEALKTDFKFPSSIDFIATDGSVITLPSNSNSNSTPSGSAYNGAKLAFTSTNIPIRAYDEELNKILVKLDAVESCGVERVRERRKAVVRAIEQEAGRVEEVWKNVWEKYGKREKMNEDGIIKSPTSDSELLEGTRSSDLGVGSTVEESSVDSESVPVVDVDASTIANTNSSSSAPISVITILEPVIEELADGVEAALKDPLDFVDLTPSLDSHSDSTLQSESDMELDDSDSDDESVERSASDLQSEDGSERDFVML